MGLMPKLTPAGKCGRGLPVRLACPCAFSVCPPLFPPTAESGNDQSLETIVLYCGPDPDLWWVAVSRGREKENRDRKKGAEGVAWVGAAQDKVGQRATQPALQP